MSWAQIAGSPSCWQTLRSPLPFQHNVPTVNRSLRFWLFFLYGTIIPVDVSTFGSHLVGFDRSRMLQNRQGAHADLDTANLRNYKKDLPETYDYKHHQQCAGR